jgi:hypothetical protein
MAGHLALVAIVVVAFAPFAAPVERSAKESHEEHGVPSPDDHSEGIRGRMSLSEIESATGVPATYVIEWLSLPEDTSLDDGVGKLGREHGFDVDAVREAVKAYNEGMKK